MILDIILSDHKAGRDLFSLAGNSVFEGYAERADLFERFDRLWPAHGRRVARRGQRARRGHVPVGRDRPRPRRAGLW